MLTSPKLPSGESDIELHKDGSWQVHVAKKEIPVKEANMDSTVEIISDDVGKFKYNYISSNKT